MLRATLEGATDGAWPAVAPAISGLNGKLGGGGDVKENPGVVLTTGGLPNVPKPGGGLTVTFGVGCRGSGHVKARCTRATRTHTRGH